MSRRPMVMMTQDGGMSHLDGASFVLNPFLEKFPQGESPLLNLLREGTKLRLLNFPFFSSLTTMQTHKSFGN